MEDCEVAPDRVFTAYLGVDHGVFRPNVKGGSETVARHGGHPELPYVLCVASSPIEKMANAMAEGLKM